MQTNTHTHFSLTIHFSLFFQLSILEMNADDDEIHSLLAQPCWTTHCALRKDDLRIDNTLAARDEYLQQRSNANGRPRPSTLQMWTSALWQLAYGGAANMFDEYLHVADTIDRECLNKFCQGVVEAFGNTFNRKTNGADFQFLLNLHWRLHEFHGTLGSIDSIHWQWKNCPTSSGFKWSLKSLLTNDNGYGTLTSV